LPERLDFNGFPDWMVEIAASQYIRTEGVQLLLPEDILKRPRGWEEAVKKYANLIMVAKPQDKTSGLPSANEASGA
jgi:hypothetical protein